MIVVGGKVIQMSDTARKIVEEYKERGGSPGLNIINLAKEYHVSKEYVQGVVDGAHAQIDINWDHFRKVRYGGKK